MFYFLGVDCIIFIIKKFTKVSNPIRHQPLISRDIFCVFLSVYSLFLPWATSNMPKLIHTLSRIYAPSMYLLCELSICQSIKKIFFLDWWYRNRQGTEKEEKFLRLHDGHILEAEMTILRNKISSGQRLDHDIGRRLIHFIEFYIPHSNWISRWLRIWRYFLWLWA